MACLDSGSGYLDFDERLGFYAGLPPQNGSQEDLQGYDLQGVHGTDGFQVRLRCYPATAALR